MRDKKDLYSNEVTVTRETVNSAPKYDHSTTMLKMEKAIIVEKGTESGKCTVDLQCVNKHGQKYIIMISGQIMACIGEIAKIANM